MISTQLHKLFKYLLPLLFLLPLTAQATTTIPWAITNLTDGFIFPNPVNGSAKGILVSASSTVNGNLSVSSLTSGDCVQASTGGLLVSASGACGSGGSSTFPFTPTSYGNSTSTTIAFLNGLISNGSTTVSGLISGLVGNNNGLLYGFASSSLFGFIPQPAGNYITALTGDVTASGPGSVAATLATVNPNVGTFTYPSVTVNGKGLITAISNGTAPSPYPFPLPGNATSSLTQFNGGASTTELSAYSAYFGATATSSFDTTGRLTFGGNANLGTNIIYGNSFGSGDYLEMNGASNYILENGNNGYPVQIGSDYLELTPGGEGHLMLSFNNNAGLSYLSSGVLEFGNGTYQDTSGGFIAASSTISSGQFSTQNALKDAALSGLIAGNSGLTYAVSTTSMNASITGSAGSVANSLTFNSSGSGGSSPQVFNGSSAETISYNTIGAQVAGNYDTFSYPFPSSATSSILTFTGGIVVNAATSTFTNSPIFTSLIAGGTVNANPSGTLYSQATTTVSCAGTASCSPFTTFGSSPFTITGSGDTFAYPFPLISLNYGATANATSSIVSFNAGLFASSTSNFANTTAVNATTTSFENANLASTTNLVVSSLVNGNCVQAGAAGLLTTIASSCGANSLSISSETPVGTINGSNTVFTTTNTPAILMLNGAYQTPGGTDYTLTGSGPYTETFVNAPLTGSILRSLYSTSGSGGAAGSTGQIQYNNGGAFGASSFFSITPSTGAITTGGTVPTIAYGSGAGSGATGSIAGNENSQGIVITAAGVPAANSVIATITLPTSCPNSATPEFSAASKTSAELSASGAVWVATSTTGYTINSSDTGIVSGTTYRWTVGLQCW